MKIKLSILILLLLFLIVELIHFGYLFCKPVTTFKKDVVVGKIDLSGKTWDEGTSILNSVFNKPIYLNLEDSSRAITLLEIGISIDRDRLARTTKTCRFSKPNILCKNTSNEPVIPQELIRVEKDKLNSYLDELENELQSIKDNTIISFSDYSFRTLSSSASITIDRSPFESKEALANLISQDDMKIMLKIKTTDDSVLQQKSTLDLIDTISNPLLIKYGGTPVYIPKEVMNKIIKKEIRNLYLYGTISLEEINTYLTSLKETYESEDVKIFQDESAGAIQNAILLRAADLKINNAIILPIEGNPKTNGELHDVYLEIVKSQQRLYRFEHGNVVRTYVISTGLTWDTPAGNYSILGKQKMTISYFGNWYMPDYLPIGTIGGVYRFGFHAIPYHMDGNGNIYSRDPNTMGSPATGGCIQLKPAAALELYNWAKVGTPVYIYD